MTTPMHLDPATDVYTPHEIAAAAGVPVEEVLALAGVSPYMSHADAVRLGRIAAGRATPAWPARTALPLFSTLAPSRERSTRGVPLALSSALHVCAVAVLFIATLGLAPKAQVFHIDERPSALLPLVFLSTPGPGGGGGGGGLQQSAPPPKALREGHERVSSPLPKRDPPRPIVSIPKPPEPKPPPLAAERLPEVVAPILAAAADARTRPGVLAQTMATVESHGPGTGGGAGTGAGTGLGQGDGPGVGTGSGGGTGGGPYRPGSGIDPPRLVREVKADYTEDARQKNLEGEVVLEIVVRRDGSVGDVNVKQGLGGGLNERAVQAVRGWQFAPARRLGAPVDVIVEVSVEFKLR